jgi:hypothetical protein
MQLGSVSYTCRNNTRKTASQVWEHSFVIPALGSQRQENLKFKTSVDYIARCCLNKGGIEGSPTIMGLLNWGKHPVSTLFARQLKF